MDDFNFAFAELPADYFPFTVTFYSYDDLGGLDPLHVIEVTGPGAITVPALRTQTGLPVWVSFRFPDGSSAVSHPPVL